MIIAIDVGGTKTLIADFDSDGAIGQEIRFETPKNTDEFFNMLLTTLGEAYPDKGLIEAICIALPGIINDDGTLAYAPNLGWHDLSVKEHLTQVYDCAIFVQNDANLAGLAEAHALPTVPRLSLYVTISTGIGTGVVVDGKLLPALNKSEGGHMLLEYDGIMREWEDFASGKSIRETYGKYAYEITSKKTWDQITDKISRGLLALIPMFQPDVIVIGGSIGTHFDKYKDTLRKLLRDKLKASRLPLPELIQAAHPEKAVIYGCYYYTTHQLTD